MSGKKELIEKVETFILRAVHKDIEKENIAVFIHHSDSGSKKQEKLFHQHLTKPKESYDVEKYRNHTQIDILIKNPYTLNLFKKLNEKYKDSCQIIYFSNYNELLEDENATNLFSTEFKCVICVFPDYIKSSGRLESYFTFSRATMNLVIISGKEGEYHPTYQTTCSRLNTFKNFGSVSKKSEELSESGFFLSDKDSRVICFYCDYSVEYSEENPINHIFEQHDENSPDCFYKIILVSKETLNEQNIEKLCEELRSYKIRTSENLEIFDD